MMAAFPRVSLRWRFLLAHLSVAVVSVVISAVYAWHALHRNFTRHVQENMMAQARLLADEVARSNLPLVRNTQWDTLARGWSTINQGHWTITDSSCRVIGNSDSNTQSGQAHPERGMTPALRGGSGVCIRHSTRLRGTELLLAVPIRRNGMIVGVLRGSIPLREINLRIRFLRDTLLGAAGILLLLSLGMSLYWSKMLSDPLRQMEGMARRIAQGNWDARVDTQRTDEVGSLAQSLNRMATDLHRMFDEVQRFAQAQQDLVANVAHELRTPVATIRAAAETLTLAAREQPGSVGQLSEIVQLEAERLSRLIDDLLRLARLQARTTAEREEVALSTIVQDALKMTSVTRHDRTLTIVTDLEDLQMVCDREAMTRVLINLLDNAIRHTPDGGKIILAGRRDKDWVLLSITDTGEGIAAEHLPHIFERFYRVDESRSTQSGGAGLGLAIVREVVESHGGTVTASSSPGKGTVITINIPVGECGCNQ